MSNQSNVTLEVGKSRNAISALSGCPTGGGSILVVDDALDWRDMVGGLLQDAGYTVTIAGDSGSAMQLLREYPFHVAIVDLRLDETDETNKEGLTLARSMRDFSSELAIIILTGYADVSTVKEALQPDEHGKPIAFDFIEKHEFSRLLSRIEVAFESAVKVNPRLKIELEEPLSWQMIHRDLECLRSLEEARARCEICDVLKRLFYDADSILLKPLPNGHSGGAVVLARPSSQDIAQADVVVKFDEAHRVIVESENYHRHVFRLIGGARHTKQEDVRSTARLGAVSYSLVGARTDEFRLFERAYVDESADTIEKILDNLFLDTCGIWYENTLRPNRHQQALGPLYRDWLSLDDEKLNRAIRELVESSEKSLSFADSLAPKRSTILFHDNAVILQNPLPVSQAPFSYRGQFCYTHGDLHEGNILVDGHNHTWLIDFYRTGQAHPFRDFALLESAIRFYLQRSSASFAILYGWEQSLGSLTGFDQEPTLNFSTITDVELTKATQLILHLRKLAHQILPEMSFHDYQVSLYFHALKAMTLRRKFSDMQRRHAMVSASILSEFVS